MKRFLSLVALTTFLLTGCSSLIPKRVELGQDKVEKMPVAKSSERETQRQTAQRAALRADETLRAAILEDSSPAVVTPAAETTVLAGAVSRSLGPPTKPSTDSTDILARKLDTAIAKLNARVDDFRYDNDKNFGKAIEGTGFLQIPYVVWLGGAFVLVFIIVIVVGIGWTALKAYSFSNPPVALGLKAVQTGGALAAKAVGQLVGGGEKFKGWLKTELPHVSDEVKKQVEELFISAHKESSDETVRNVVKELVQR